MAKKKTPAKRSTGPLRGEQFLDDTSQSDGTQRQLLNPDGTAVESDGETSDGMFFPTGQARGGEGKGGGRGGKGGKGGRGGGSGGSKGSSTSTTTRIKNTGATNIGQVKNVTASQTEAAQQSAAEQAAAAREFNASNSGAANLSERVDIDPTTLANAERAGNTQIGDFERAIAARADTGRSDTFRDRQLGVLGGLDKIISGEEKSLAELQFEQSREANLAGVQSQLASSAGTNALQRARLGTQGAAQVNMGSARDAAMLRLREVQAAREQSASINASSQGLDQQIAMTDAAAANNMASLNAQQANQRTSQQAAMDQNVNLANADAATRVNMQNAQANNARAMTQADLIRQTNQFNAGAMNQSGQFNAQLQQQAAAANAAAFNATNQFNTSLRQDQNQKNNQAVNATNQFNTSLRQGADTSNAAAFNQAMATNASLNMNQQVSAANNRATTGAASIAANASMYGTNVNAETSRLGMILNQSQQQGANNIAHDQSHVGAEAEKKRRRDAQVGAVIGAVAQVGAGAVSDVRVKKDIKPGHEQTQKFLDALGSYMFKYKDGESRGEGDFIGTMAQDLEKSSLGKVMVNEDASGTKQIEIGKNGMGILFAAMANLNERIKNSEKNKDR
jgi:hypothetical protein